MPAAKHCRDAPRRDVAAQVVAGLRARDAWRSACVGCGRVQAADADELKFCGKCRRALFCGPECLMAACEERRHRCSSAL